MDTGSRSGDRATPSYTFVQRVARAGDQVASGAVRCPVAVENLARLAGVSPGDLKERLWLGAIASDAAVVSAFPL